MSKQQEYYQMASNWVNEYLENNKPESFMFEGNYIIDTHYTLKLWKDRLEQCSGAEQKASFIRIKKFKDYVSGK